MNTYRIELRREGQPTLFWWSYGNLAFGEWMSLSESATCYTEEERDESLKLHVEGKPNGFPEGGIWVKADKVSTDTGYENGRYFPSRLEYVQR